MTASLLIVDDDDDARAVLRLVLTHHGYAVHEAAGGDAVFPLLGRRHYDLVLLDIDMPGIGGMEVLHRIRDRYPPDELPVMMATAMKTSGDIVTALCAGANDYVTKPFDIPVVLARIRTQCCLAQARHQLERANRRMRMDLEAAARVQRTLLPAPVPSIPGVECAWHYRPCTELAGDLLGLLTLPDHSVCLYVLDVVHHGVKAALLAVMINRFLSRLLADGPPPPADVAAALCREFPYDDRTEQYFTLQLGFYDPPSGVFRFVTAGHPGPIVVRDGRPELCRFPSSPVGLGDGAYEEQTLRLAPGDRLYLFSDGLTEAHGTGRPNFGTDRCLNLVRGAEWMPLSDSVTHLVTAALEWCHPDPPHDDVTVVAIERR